METAHDSAQSAAATPPSRWARATEDDTQAMRELAASFWYCAYAWWRRSGLEAADAAGATVECFTRWLTHSPPRAAHTRGHRMREWLPARLGELARHGVHPEGAPEIEMDPGWAERRFADEPAGDADAIFHRRWALTMLEFSMLALRGEYEARGQEGLFAEVAPFAGFEGGEEERYTIAAARQGMTAGAMRKAVFDFRKRHRELLRGFVADTVMDPEDVDSEITALLCACDVPGTELAAAPLPTAIRHFKPDELLARAMHAVQMTHTGAGGQWTPPSDGEIARLFPQYEMRGMLGRGGMGAVYKGRQVALDRFVAIKLLPLEVSVDREFADRFVREARAMAKLNHPNILDVYDFGTTSEGHLYFVMEFVEGANLAEMIHAGNRGASATLNSDQALGITGQVCSALAYAHAKGIVHRDIKPANVMVDLEGTAKVADFGLARLSDPGAEQMGHTVTGTVMGTPDYMAPEQKRGMNVDHRADIYSVGVMLYEMLCKETPQGVFEPPSMRVGCDASLDQIVIKAMNRDPEKRYQSTQEMQADVEAARTPVPSPARSSMAAAKAETPVAPERSRVMMRPITRQSSRSWKKPKHLLYATLGVAAMAIAGISFVLRDGRKETLPPVASHDEKPPPPLEPGAIRINSQTERVWISPESRWEGETVYLGPSGRMTYAEVLSRDMTVRAAVQMAPGAAAPQICLRKKKGPEDCYYRIVIHQHFNRLDIDAVQDNKSLRLKQAPLPRSYAAGEWVVLEAMIVGDQIIVSLDGKMVCAVNDTSIAEPGSMMLHATTNGVFRDIVYVPLDKTGTLPPPPLSVTPPPAVTPVPVSTRTKPIFNGHEYLFVKEPLTWDEANARAKVLGGYLAAITTAEEAKFLAETFGEGLSSTSTLWLGGECVDPDRQWRWVTGEPWSHTEWLPGEPKFPSESAARYVLQFGKSGEQYGWSATLRGAAKKYFFVERGTSNPAGAVSSKPAPSAATPSEIKLPGSSATATKEAPFENSLGMKFVPVRITRGPTAGHRVLFSIWETRIQDYAAFVDATQTSWSGRPPGSDGLLPAGTLSWDNAQQFCAWLTTRERQMGRISANEMYRLPSDHEWSTAAGIGDLENPMESPAAKSRKIEEVYYWGKGFPPPLNSGNYRGKEYEKLGSSDYVRGYEDAFLQAAPVGSFEPNAEGLYDMGGNVQEWCEDLFDSAGADRTTRDCGWEIGIRPEFLVSSRRYNHTNMRIRTLGFRVVLAPSSTAPGTSGSGAVVRAVGANAWADWLDGLRKRNLWITPFWKDEGQRVECQRQVMLPFGVISRDHAVRVTWSIPETQRDAYVALRFGQVQNAPQYRFAFHEAGRLRLEWMDGSNPAPVLLTSWALPPNMKISAPNTYEFRAAGQALTASVNGMAIGSFTHSGVTQGGAQIWTGPGVVLTELKFAYFDLPGAGRAAAAGAEKWVNGLGEWLARPENQSKLTRAANGSMRATASSVRMTPLLPAAPPLRDQGVRVTFRMTGANDLRVYVRGTSVPGQNDRAYVAWIDRRMNMVRMVGYLGEGTLKNFPSYSLPGDFGLAAAHRLELRAVGALLTVALDGKKVLEETDGRVATGHPWIEAPEGVMIESFEYADLAGAGR